MSRFHSYLALFISFAFTYAQNIETFAQNLNTNYMKTITTWKNGEAKLVVSGLSDLPSLRSKVELIKIKYTQYGSRFPLAVLPDPYTRYNYIVSRCQSFYITYNKDVVGCLLAGGELICKPSYFKMPLSNGDIDKTIAEFVSDFDENKLTESESKMFRVPLSLGAPFPFFTANSLGGSQPGTPTIKAIDLKDYILRLDLLSSGNKFNGSFWIDLKARKLIKSVVDGQEMNLSTGKPFAIPLHINK